jgi:hypothetical protein
MFSICRRFIDRDLICGQLAFSQAISGTISGSVKDSRGGDSWCLRHNKKCGYGHHPSRGCR